VYAYVRIAVDNRWYEYDDELVNLVKPHQVVSSEAYLLFYEKRPHKRQQVRKEKIERALIRSSALQAEHKAQITHYVSFYWTIKWATMTNPGSVSNRYATCEHDRLVWPEDENPALRLVGVTEEMWDLLKEEYGAGDPLCVFKRCEDVSNDSELSIYLSIYLYGCVFVRFVCLVTSL
jgi:ubiquitin carboxyl-terminal hydrolase 20/33